MSSDGYVKVYRSLLGHPAFRNDAESMAFAWMVMRAAWQPTRVRYKERSVELQRGQLVVSVRDMAAAMDRDKAWVERLWKRLRAEGMIETVRETVVSVVTICKYEEYQASSDVRETVGKTPRKTAKSRDTRETVDETPGETDGIVVSDGNCGENQLQLLGRETPPETAQISRRDTEQGIEEGRKKKDSVDTDVSTGGKAPPIEGDHYHLPALIQPEPAPLLDAAALTKILFDTGRAILADMGIADGKARSIVGRWRKDYSDGAVLSVLAKAQVEKPSNPIEWITAALFAEKRTAMGASNAHRNITPPPARPNIVQIGQAVLAERRAREAGADGRRYPDEGAYGLPQLGQAGRHDDG